MTDRFWLDTGFGLQCGGLVFCVLGIALHDPWVAGIAGFMAFIAGYRVSSRHKRREWYE